MIWYGVDLMMLSRAGVQVSLESSLYFSHMGHSFKLLFYINERKKFLSPSLAWDDSGPLQVAIPNLSLWSSERLRANSDT